MAEKSIHCETEESAKPKRDAPIVTDDELDSILNDALKDFSKSDTDTDGSGESCKNAKPKAPYLSKQEQKPFNESNFENFFTEEGLTRMTAELSSAFAGMDDDVLKRFERGSTAGSNTSEGLPHGQSLEENLENAWKSMEENLKDSQEGQPDDFFEKDFMNAMKGLGLEDPGSTPESFISMMQGMMTNLLSKDILYPSLKEIEGRYPAWLEENRSKLSKEELHRFSKQHELCSRVCSEFEKETETDTEEAKKARMEKIMELMQRMQEYGHPPVDILGQVEADSDSPSGSGKLNVNPEQCICM